MICQRMSQKPKRIISNFSFDMLQQAKDICRNSIQDYKDKFALQPTYKTGKAFVRPQTSSGSNKLYQSTKLLQNKHSYTVESNKINTDKIISQLSSQNDTKPESVKFIKPNKSNQLKRTQSNFQSESKDFKTLFQNQHLSASLKSSQTFQNQTFYQSTLRSHKKYRSLSSACISINQNMCVIKTGADESSQDVIDLLNHQTPKNKQQQSIKSILSSKQNFYNPYNISPFNTCMKPIKHLRSKSIDQLKQLCQQQRNLNFNSKIQQIQCQKQNQSKCIIKNKIKFFENKTQNRNEIKVTALYQNYAVPFKKAQKSSLKKANPTWFVNKNRFKNIEKKLESQCFLVAQINK